MDEGATQERQAYTVTRRSSKITRKRDGECQNKSQGLRREAHLFNTAEIHIPKHPDDKATSALIEYTYTCCRTRLET